jgi:hypothetical protein
MAFSAVVSEGLRRRSAEAESGDRQGQAARWGEWKGGDSAWQTGIAVYPARGLARVGSRVVIGTGVKIDGVARAFRQCVHELDMSGLFGDVALPRRSFAGCGALSFVRLPRGLISMGDGCFEDCGLVEFDAGGTRLVFIGDRCFGNCKQLARICLTSTLKQMGKGCFSGTEPSRRWVYPYQWHRDSIRPRGGCPLTTLDLSRTCLTVFSASAFEGCQRLQRLSLPPTLESLEMSCLRGTSL